MSENKKILFILHVPPPIHGSSVIGSYIKGSTSVKEAFNSKFINLGTSKTIDEIGKNAGNKIIGYFKILFQVLKQLLFFRPKVVYLSMTAKGVGFYKDVLVALLIKIFGRQLVLHFHNKGVGENQDNAFDNLLYKLVFKNTKVILLSEHLYFDIKKYVNKENVFICANGIEQQNYNLSVEKNDKVQLLFLSNILKSKGVFVLLEALSILKKRNVTFHCNLVGGIGDVSEKDLTQKIIELNLKEYIDYLGSRIAEEKSIIFKKADIFVHPTLRDCFPLVLLEASQYKLPMVSTLEGAIPEIIDQNESGFLVPKNDAIALSEKLEILIKEEALRYRMGENAYQKYLREYTLKAFEQRFITILKSIN